MTSRPRLHKTVVIDVVGLSPRLIGEHTPHIRSLLSRGAQCEIRPTLPAVTTTAQTTYITGATPTEHGIVGNGWYFRDDAEIRFWRQSNHLVQKEKVWDVARRLDDSFTVSKMFWWYNMYSTADYACTPRPCYPADGRKIPDVYTTPPELRDELQKKLGQFPLFNFWGPTADRRSSDWIAESAKIVEEKHNPTLTLIYLPHLDYCLQGVSTKAEDISKELNEIDEIVGDLIEFYKKRDATGATGVDRTSIILLSEYGITPVKQAVHINRALRAEGLITVRVELGKELLDAGASRAFAVTDHQIAHIYVNDESSRDQVAQIVKGLDGVGRVLETEAEKKEAGLAHRRAGDIVAIAEEDAWFTYYYWEDDDVAPDFARCVDIHRKPGYDPVELFIDPSLSFPKVKAGFRLLQKNLGFRYLMDLIPLDASLPVGSHGAITERTEDSPVFITTEKQLIEGRDKIQATDVFDLILKALKHEQGQVSENGMQ